MILPFGAALMRVDVSVHAGEFTSLGGVKKTKRKRNSMLFLGVCHKFDGRFQRCGTCNAVRVIKVIFMALASGD
jgi:hypothetical protein